MKNGETKANARDKKRLTVFAVIHLTAMLACPVIALFVSGAGNILSLPAVSLAYYIGIAALPVCLYMHVFDRISPFCYMKMTGRVLPGIGWGLLIGVMIGGIFFLVNGAGLPDAADIRRDIWMIGGAALVGMIEEIPFRGFYLQKFAESVGFIKANILSSLLFALLHAATLIRSGGDVVLPLILLFVISLWLGYIFKKTQSFWTAAVVHAAYNLAVYLF